MPFKKTTPSIWLVKSLWGRKMEGRGKMNIMNTELQNSFEDVTTLDERQKKTHEVEANPNSKWGQMGFWSFRQVLQRPPEHSSHEGCRSSPVQGQFTLQSVHGSCCWQQFALIWQIMNFCCYGVGWGSATPAPGTGPRGQLETFGSATGYKSAWDISSELGCNSEDLVTFTPEKLFSLTNSLD